MQGMNLGPSIISAPIPTQPQVKSTGPSNQSNPIPGGTVQLTSPPNGTSAQVITPPLSPRDIQIIHNPEPSRRMPDCADIPAVKFFTYCLPGAIAGAGIAYGLYPAMVGVPVTLATAATIGGFGACAQSTIGGTINFDNQSPITLGLTYGCGLGGAAAGAVVFGVPPLPVTIFSSVGTCLLGHGGRIAAGNDR